MDRRSGFWDRWRLLGPAGPVRPGAAKERYLLAVLALHPGEEPKHNAAAIEARFQLNRWTSTGVLPRGAQVERTIGVSETPDSSKKQMTALRRLAFF